MFIREAKLGDEKDILFLIKELAGYEKAPEQVINTEKNLANDLFVDKICSALVACEDEKIIAFALWYTSYSTWKGKCLYLEDFFVLPDYRKFGVGGKLFDEVVKIAKLNGVKRMDWQVLEWNKPAIEFYKKKNSILDSEWINGRLFF